jgi:hypothetical protein
MFNSRGDPMLNSDFHRSWRLDGTWGRDASATKPFATHWTGNPSANGADNSLIH